MVEENKIAGYRNIVIDKHIETDFIVSSLICLNYLGELNYNFISDVLYALPTSSRINILGKILKDRCTDSKGLIRKLENMNTIRNKFAHGSDKIGFGEMYGYPCNPKDMSKKIDFEKEYKRFSSYFEEVHPVLFETGYAIVKAIKDKERRDR